MKEIVSNLQISIIWRVCDMPLQNLTCSVGPFLTPLIAYFIKSALWMCGITPPPEIVPFIRWSSSSSPLIASYKCLGVILLTFRSLLALPASSKISAVRYSKIAARYTAEVLPTLLCPWTLYFNNLWILPTGNYIDDIIGQKIVPEGLTYVILIKELFYSFSQPFHLFHLYLFLLPKWMNYFSSVKIVLRPSSTCSIKSFDEPMLREDWSRSQSLILSTYHMMSCSKLFKIDNWISLKFNNYVS